MSRLSLLFLLIIFITAASEAEVEPTVQYCGRNLAAHVSHMARDCLIYLSLDYLPSPERIAEIRSRGIVGCCSHGCTVSDLIELICNGKK
ncbi:hypothetical protein PRIPAC_96937 [Pristionchus pacificus]|uniref:Uncharacterized protein n=1 Tax=Pristionchus pacificus TaxID=54126 RepID=A0A2A6D2G2_PRIPA|nr:hypothetical protein PRIPAC_96937 [Pristionchus pacificus]|eukprot:PDM84662.1 hypothetical protein PRIPAC_33685 [Pristionchus pacificus]